MQKDDVIYRQAAIDAVVQSLVGWDGMFRQEANCRIRDAINELPSAEPRTGRWIEDAETFYKAVNEHGGGVDENTPYFTDDIACSKCLAKFSTIDNQTERFDFCPHCGADMRGEQDDKCRQV